MSKRIMILLMAATLAGGLFAPEAQARGIGGGHGGGLGGGLGGGHMGGFHGMHIPGEGRDPRVGGDFGRIRMGSGLRHEIHIERRHEFCDDSDCGLYGCRYLWQSANACY